MLRISTQTPDVFGDMRHIGLSSDQCSEVSDYVEQKFVPMEAHVETVKNFIPFIQNMIAKEKEHLAFLKVHSKKYPEQEDVQDMIDTSEVMLEHYEHRLKEYKEYTQKHEAREQETATV